MINRFEVDETNKMIEQERLDVRTITMGISLLDCIDSDLEKVKENIYRKITSYAKDLVSVGGEIEVKYGIPIVNNRLHQDRNQHGRRPSHGPDDQRNSRQNRRSGFPGLCKAGGILQCTGR